MTCKKEQNMDSFREFEGKIHEEGWLLCISGVSFVSVLPLSKHTSLRLSSPVPSSEIVSKTDDVSEDSILLCGWVPNHTEFSKDSGLEQSPVTKKTYVLCKMKVNMSWKFVFTGRESEWTPEAIFLFFTIIYVCYSAADPWKVIAQHSWKVLCTSVKQIKDYRS